jgi:hypothetical protein
LEAENSDLLRQLLPYVQEVESQQKEEENLNLMMANALADAEHNMNNDGFFIGYDEKELIENKKYLKESLEETKEEGVAEEVEAEPLTEEEQLLIEENEKMVEEAMHLQGFYEDVEEAVLVGREADGAMAPGVEDEDDDELLENKLKEADTLLAENPLYQEEIQAELFIEDAALLEQKLKELDEDIDETEEFPIVTVDLDDNDHLEMDKALEFAMQNMENEGLYAPIDSQKLIGGNDLETIVVGTDPLYASEVEQLVVNEVGKSIPKANDRKDDLKKIDGIGMFLEEQLNYFGIYNYEQIAAFDDNFIDKLTAAIGFSENTVYRDKWVEQAKDMTTKN